MNSLTKVIFILASALSTLSTRVVFAELLTPSAPVVGVAADTQSDPNASNDAARSSQPSASTVTLAPDQAIPLSAADQHFLQMAAMRNLTNAEAGKLAISNSNDIGIKAIGQRMIDNPMNLSDQLTNLASKKHTRLPTVPDSRQQAMLVSLGNKKGRAFDRAFTVNMKTARIEALRLYTLGAKSRDFDVASFSTMILQALRSQQQNRVAIR